MLMISRCAQTLRYNPEAEDNNTEAECVTRKLEEHATRLRQLMGELEADSNSRQYLALLARAKTLLSSLRLAQVMPHCPPRILCCHQLVYAGAGSSGGVCTRGRGGCTPVAGCVGTGAGPARRQDVPKGRRGVALGSQRVERCSRMRLPPIPPLRVSFEHADSPVSHSSLKSPPPSTRFTRKRCARRRWVGKREGGARRQRRTARARSASPICRPISRRLSTTCSDDSTHSPGMSTPPETTSPRPDSSCCGAELPSSEHLRDYVC
jgi:hypothetical protein